MANFKSMKYLLLLLSGVILVSFSGNFTQTLNIKDYGAVGDGVTDCTAAIQACLNAAQSAHKNIFVPPGKYKCDVTNSSHHVLEYTASGQNYISIYGVGDTILHTISDTNTLLYVQAFSTSSHLTIAGLTLLNTHAATTAPSCGIFLQGTSGQNLDTVSLLHDTAIGFQVKVQAQGVTGLNIWYSGFYSPLGHDNGIHASSVPCPDIWCFDNSNGKVFNADIEQNTGNGYAGTFPITVSRPSDGFFYGVIYGAKLIQNRLSNYSQEFVDIQPYGTISETNSPYFIAVNSNELDCHIPSGSVDDNGVAHKNNYGIRIDCPNASVHYNTIKDYVWGFMSRPTDFSTDSVYNFDVSENIFITPSDTTTNIVQHDLYFAGNSYQSPNIKFYSNTTLRSDTSRVFINNAASPVNQNVFRPTNQ